MTKLWTGHEICPVTGCANIWPPSVTLTLEAGDLLLSMTHLLIIVSNCGKNLQNPFRDREDQTRDILSKRQVDLEWASATLTLEVGVWLLRMTHRLIIINICAKLFQIPFINDKVMDRTRKCDGRTAPKMVLMWLSLWSFWPFLVTRGLKQDTQVKTKWIGSKRSYCYPLFSKSHSTSGFVPPDMLFKV